MILILDILSHPLVQTGLVILAIVAVVIVLSFVVSLIITPIMISLVDKSSRRTAKKVYEYLPKKDCGQCGCETCMDYALKISDMRSKPYNCGELNEDEREKIAAMFRPDDNSDERLTFKEAIKQWRSSKKQKDSNNIR
jgi:Na+-translocating ferredoxin:NAD+ oxidoreductase RNF subunit RnfB